MKTSDISDVTVCAAFLDAFLHGELAGFADEVLEMRTGAPPKVRLAAMKRAQRRGFIKVVDSSKRVSRFRVATSALAG